RPLQPLRHNRILCEPHEPCSASDPGSHSLTVALKWGKQVITISGWSGTRGGYASLSSI
ncbi:MAG: hypothetical protein H6Q33_5386, partial [Deltaproteobacteria bacterium]|nr:hypothetical protein [Deltaproteobacteria bacterium]